MEKAHVRVSGKKSTDKVQNANEKQRNRVPEEQRGKDRKETEHAISGA